MRNRRSRWACCPCRAGFTVVEVLVAIMLLAVGLVGLATGLALATRMVARGRAAETVARFVTGRVEQLRAAGCTSRTPGVEAMRRGGRPIATVAWEWQAAARGTYRLLVVTRSLVRPYRFRVDTMATAISCQP